MWKYQKKSAIGKWELNPKENKEAERRVNIEQCEWKGYKANTRKGNVFSISHCNQRKWIANMTKPAWKLVYQRIIINSLWPNQQIPISVQPSLFSVFQYFVLFVEWELPANFRFFCHIWMNFFMELFLSFRYNFAL